MAYFLSFELRALPELRVAFETEEAPDIKQGKGALKESLKEIACLKEGRSKGGQRRLDRDGWGLRVLLLSRVGQALNWEWWGQTAATEYLMRMSTCFCYSPRKLKDPNGQRLTITASQLSPSGLFRI